MAKNRKITGLRIHTAHSDFDFDKIAVDLLEKFNLIKNSAPVSRKQLPLSSEDIVTLALQLSPGQALTKPLIQELSKNGRFVSMQQIRSNFGDVRKFQEACGFKPQLRMDAESIVELALELSPDKPLGKTAISSLAKEHDFVGYAVILDRFGSLRAFHLACGFKAKKSVVQESAFSRLNNMTNDELVNLARELIPSKLITKEDIERFSKARLFVSVPTVRKRFGDFTRFAEACGFHIPVGRQGLENEEIIALAKDLSPDAKLLTPELRALGKAGKLPSLALIIKRFGSVKAFQDACDWCQAPVFCNTRSELCSSVLSRAA
jgi:hypothetical protein